GQRDRARKLALERDVDEPPARIVTPALRVVVPGAAVELGRIGARFAHDLHDADDGRDLAARMVEERLVAGLHVAPHHVAHLEIAHSVPARTAVPFEIVDAVGVGFRLHEPVGHASSFCPCTGSDAEVAPFYTRAPGTGPGRGGVW